MNVTGKQVSRCGTVVDVDTYSRSTVVDIADTCSRMLRRVARLAVSPAVSLHLARAVMLNDGHKRRHIAVLLAMGASLVSSTAAACAPKQTDAMAALSEMYQDNESDDGERDGGDGDDDDGERDGLSCFGPWPSRSRRI